MLPLQLSCVPLERPHILQTFRPIYSLLMNSGRIQKLLASRDADVHLDLNLFNTYNKYSATSGDVEEILVVLHIPFRPETISKVGLSLLSLCEVVSQSTERFFPTFIPLNMRSSKDAICQQDPRACDLSEGMKLNSRGLHISVHESHAGP